jgi:hypothetical protein
MAAKTSRKRPDRPTLKVVDDKKLSFNVPDDLTGRWRTKFIELAQLVKDSTGLLTGTDADLAATVVRGLAREEYANKMAMTEAEAGDMKTFAAMTAIAGRSGNGARSGLRELKQTPFLRANRQAKAEAAKRIGASTTDAGQAGGPQAEDDDGSDGWGDLI